jgi:dihydrofolate reductase
MGRIIATFQMTLDGVFDHLDEWYHEHADLQRASHELLFATDAVLIGRKTYAILAPYWLNASDERGFVERLNTLPKFVASSTLPGPLDWNATLIDGDVVEAVRALKDQYDTRSKQHVG